MGITARRIVMLLAACAIATPNVLEGSVARFRGTFPAPAAGGTVTIERFDASAGAWIAVASALVASDGSYVATWRADVTGRIRTRAQLDRGGGAVLAAAAPNEAYLTVYRPAIASWYGPGVYGRTTACGVKLSRRLLGVAHRRLPCGTPVALTYGGRAITVPVVDRGPFRRGRRGDRPRARLHGHGPHRRGPRRLTARVPSSCGRCGCSTVSASARSPTR